jgi:hypothetical protein
MEKCLQVLNKTKGNNINSFFYFKKIISTHFRSATLSLILKPEICGMEDIV